MTNMGLYCRVDGFTVGPYIGNGGSPAKVDLTASSASGLYASGAGAVFSYYPVVGHDDGDHQRAQQLLRFNTTQDASISEVGLAIDSVINTGLAKPYVNGQLYAAGDLIDVHGGIYRVVVAGTSAATGTGPTGQTPNVNIVDGTMTVVWQCHDQCNAKMPLFVTARAGSSAGHSWAGVYDLVLDPGWKGQFASGLEVDLQNNSGMTCTTCQTLFISGDAGSNPIQTGISIYTPSATNYYAVNAIQTGGAKLASNADAYFSTNGTYSIQDVGSHSWGLSLEGSYSSGAIRSKGVVALNYDFPTIVFQPASGANLNRWRWISTLNGAADGYITLQHTNDAFSSNFVDAIAATGAGLVGIGTTSPAYQLDVAGSASARTMHLAPQTFAALPSCNASSAGTLAYIVDANVAVNMWHQQITGGGSVNKAFIACNGTGWYAFDF